MKRFFKLINGDNVFGEIETVQTESGQTEIIIKKPFTAKHSNMMPYMADEVGESPGGIQIHPMNVVWSVPLSEFPELNKAHIEVTTGLVTETKPQIIV